MSPREHILQEELPCSCPGIWEDGYACSCDPGHGELTGQQMAMLDLETKFSTGYDRGLKSAAIRDLMGPGWQNRYYQLLHHLIRRRVAHEYAPSTVKRLHRLQGTPKWKRGAA